MNAGGRAVAVVGSEEKGEYCKELGAVGYINRKDFSHWGVPPAWDSPEWKAWFDGAKAFGKAIWDVLGEQKSPRIVFEHPGQDTIPTSNFVCDRGGMIVICAGTSGYDTMIDVRYLWYMQKRYQGSHLFNDEQAAAFNEMVIDGGRSGRRSARPTVRAGRARPPADGRRELPEGNVAVLVHAPTPASTSSESRGPQPSWTSSTRTPPIDFGWTNAISVLREPRRGASSISRTRSRRS